MRYRHSQLFGELTRTIEIHSNLVPFVQPLEIRFVLSLTVPTILRLVYQLINQVEQPQDIRFRNKLIPDIAVKSYRTIIHSVTY